MERASMEAFWESDAGRVLAALPVGVLVVGPAPAGSPILGANAAAERHLGHAAGSLVGRSFAEVAPEWPAIPVTPAGDSSPGSGPPVELRPAPGRARQRLVRTPMADGRWVLTFEPVPSSAPMPADRAAIDAERHFLEAVVENIPNMIFVKEAGELRFVRFNGAGERLLGLKREALLGKSDFDFFPAEQAAFFTEKDRLVLAGREVVDIPEEPIDTASGPRWLHTQKVPVFDEQGAPLYLLGISEDITERRAVARQLAEVVDRLERQTADLARSNRDLEQFAYVASHDLQEPLRKIRAFGERLVSKAEAGLDAESKDYLGRMMNAAARMSELVDALLRLSRVGTAPLEPARVDLAALVAEVVADVEPRAEAAGAEIRCSVAGTVVGDPTHLRQVFTNLVVNALKFHRPGQRPRVSIEGSLDSRVARIAVIDDGIGFDVAHAERIFAPFVRLHGRSEYEGAGMGLSIVRRIVERHGGRAWATSAPGAGASFHLELPVGGPGAEPGR